ncbi:AmpG family muropeptide MFS transporter [Lysobacter lacus]|uniref:AmpG family muropeptide MFS transporter n=2 Tax=Cognatilysobacter lacus TaxID=1643323 RepID=A0A5D8Z1L7_9GAMM|nr:MFS transporter [Lysobacter lacus]TZF88609.1 AmpG family muropeptide MFS transporter [Lysobacter lacus]
MFFFGFSSGLPFLLVAGTLAYWLKENGIVLKEITVIASAGMTYALKFLWAPLLDQTQVPGFRRLGLRRGWLLLAQVAVVAGLLVMAMFTPSQLMPFVVATVFVAFAGATQDIAVDAYRIEIAPPAAQGALVATYSLGYRIALIVTGALALAMADHMPWATVYLCMAALMLLPIGANLMSREPESYRESPATWREAMRIGVIDPFVDFFRRYGAQTALLTLLFILLFKVPEQALVGGIMSPFYLSMGFAKTQIGAITKLYGTWVGIAGVFAGGMAIARWGVRLPLLLSIVVCASCNLLYVWLTRHHGDLGALTLVISAENFSLGFLGTAAVAFLSSLVNRQHTATQYALLSSMVNLPGKVLGVFAGRIVEATNYSTYFIIATIAVLPATLLFLYLWPRFRSADAGAAKAAQAG